jgi:membrane associated rhomboid family serine protease
MTVLPAAATFLFLRRQIQIANICFVKDVTGRGQKDVTGIYRQRAEGFSYLRREAPFANSWSSISEMGRVLAPPVRSDKDMLWTMLAAIADITGDDEGAKLTHRSGRWCVEPGKICSPDKGERRRPSEGVYSNGTVALKVACHNVESFFVDGKTKAKEMEAFHSFVAHRPASALLMAMMLFLAYRYSNHQEPTENVAFSYDSIVERWEFWRAFTGSTAHFKPAHLAANMYSLYALGSELEESYGSIPFLLYNVALIPLTAILTLIFIKTMGGERRRHKMIVGYSGVLFSWSTVAASRLPISWPFRFGKITKDLFVKTINIGPLKFNASPLIRMGIVHLLVPSASWEGHLAGIVCGLAMQWGCLPLSLTRPAILIPSIMWLHFYAVREVIAFHAIEQVILENRNCRAIKEHQRFRYVFELIRNLLVPAGLLGCILFEWSMSLQLALVLLFLSACIMSHIEDVPIAPKNGDGWREGQRRKRRSAMLWKAFLLTCFLSVLSDCMAFGGWMSCNSFWFSDHYTPLQFWFAGILMIARIGLQAAGFAVAAKRFMDLSPDMDVFYYLFSPYHLRDGATTAMALTKALDPILLQ